MVRLADLSEAERKMHLDRVATLPEFADPILNRCKPLNQMRIALITTAGIHTQQDLPFDTMGSGMDYRVIPNDVTEKNLVMSHASVNFDRTGFQSDVNVVFPLQRMQELVSEKVIGSLAKFHYSFMGAIAPVTRYKDKVQELVGLLKQDKVDAVVLTPV
ncbi:glycine/sarcosine/betaine reductase selenoprotein B family protein [Polynucleobacter rarus]|jgi:D-proline reductase (dithiol) PrdB|uniref:glycine/sarcosine/betaine reductase selenoprotein B family protein n=1 Tax=Polynucleobacter rarus TaxID=556055 RepID=UPI000D3E2D58|nr:glycine/sarcosine/betaine reductase selenoprotein B family protein [Polynucleobacter rarus]